MQNYEPITLCKVVWQQIFFQIQAFLQFIKECKSKVIKIHL